MRKKWQENLGYYWPPKKKKKPFQKVETGRPDREKKIGRGKPFTKRGHKDWGAFIDYVGGGGGKGVGETVHWGPILGKGGLTEGGELNFQKKIYMGKGEMLPGQPARGALTLH